MELKQNVNVGKFSNLEIFVIVFSLCVALGFILYGCAKYTNPSYRIVIPHVLDSDCKQLNDRTSYDELVENYRSCAQKVQLLRGRIRIHNMRIQSDESIKD